MTTDPLLRGVAALHVCLLTVTARSRTDERGEGVISTALAVLIVAFLAAAAWLAFNGIIDNAGDRASAQVDRIGG
jgi:hypothetical protein